MTQWRAIIYETGERCVYPLDDLREHDLVGPCWCQPTDDDGVTVHRAMDRREEFERGGEGVVSKGELALLIHRLQEMAHEHERIEEDDRAADTGYDLMVAMSREEALCSSLLREAVQALETRDA